MWLLLSPLEDNSFYDTLYSQCLLDDITQERGKMGRGKRKNERDGGKRREKKREMAGWGEVSICSLGDDFLNSDNKPS